MSSGQPKSHNEILFLENESARSPLLQRTRLGPHKHPEVRLSHLTTSSGPEDVYTCMYRHTNKCKRKISLLKKRIGKCYDTGEPGNPSHPVKQGRHKCYVDRYPEQVVLQKQEVAFRLPPLASGIGRDGRELVNMPMNGYQDCGAAMLKMA